MIKHLVVFHFGAEDITFLVEYRSEKLLDDEIEDAIVSYTEANPDCCKDATACEKAVYDIMSSFDVVWQFMSFKNFNI